MEQTIEEVKTVTIRTNLNEERVLVLGRIKMKHKMAALRESMYEKIDENKKKIQAIDPFKAKALQIIASIRKGHLTYEEYLELYPQYGDALADAFEGVNGRLERLKGGLPQPSVPGRNR